MAKHTDKNNYPQTRALSWRIIHEILPISHRLYRFHLRKDPLCDYCKRVETTEHAFLYCKIANITWKEILSLIRKHEPNIDGEIILNYR